MSHKSSLGKFKKIEIVSRFFPDHNNKRLDINNRRGKTVKNTKIWRLDNTLLNNPVVTRNQRGNLKNTEKQKTMKTLQLKM